MINICRIYGCTNDAGLKSFRCPEHSSTCLAMGCDIVSSSVRCSKHAARHSRLGRSHLECVHAGCQSDPINDYDECSAHVAFVSDEQELLDAAYAKLKEYGGNFKYVAFNVPVA